MGETTAISWTDHTFNPWMGCTKVSPACDHCYAEALGKRTGKVRWGDDAARVVTSDGYWRNPVKWNRLAEAEGRRHRVFCASMADVFEDRPELREPRGRLFDLIEVTPWLDWQLLTKRPENVARLLPRYGGYRERCHLPRNVWLGVTAEDQQRLDERAPHLVAVSAIVRFLSCEPMLGPIDLLNYVEDLSWVICGGESGPGHRPMDVEHLRSLRQQCAAWDVPFFAKQDSGQHAGRQGRIPDDLWVKEFPEP